MTPRENALCKLGLGSDQARGALERDFAGGGPGAGVAEGKLRPAGCDPKPRPPPPNLISLTQRIVYEARRPALN